jgi:hypothetical protein
MKKQKNHPDWLVVSHGLSEGYFIRDPSSCIIIILSFLCTQISERECNILLFILKGKMRFKKKSLIYTLYAC